MKIKLNPENSKINDFKDLTPGNVYRVIGIEADNFRIMSDEGRPYLYDNNLFIIVDPAEPEEWITEYGEDGERYSYAPELNEVGFFEDYFDDKKKAIYTLRFYLSKWRDGKD